MIREFYQDRTILLTGGTGFVGQALAAKILRDLPQVRKLYVLIRPRKQADGKVITAAERLEEELFASSVFAAFRSADPRGFAACRARVEAVSGDVSQPGLGLDPGVRPRLAGEVELVINSAATVVFDEPLDISLRLNALGPLALLEFARQCARQAAFLHISTAYVNGQLPGRIPEEPLPPERTIRQLMEGGTPARPFDPEAEVEDCQRYCQRIGEEASSPARRQAWRREILGQRRSRSLSEQRLEQLVEDRSRHWRQRRLVEEGMRRGKAYGWNDVYTFTKALGEQLLAKKRGALPLVIVRPSIIESSLRDPEPGWITGLKVTDPLIAAYGRGLLPDFPARREMVIDVIPVDLVVNAVLAAATQASRAELRIFQVATSADNPIRIASLFNYVRAYFQKYPLRDREGRVPPLPGWTYPSLRRFRLVFHLRYLWPVRAREWVLDRLPSSLAPAAQRRLTATLKLRLKRLLYYTDIYHPYTHLNCYFETRRTRALSASLPPEEQQLFGVDSQRIDWEEYIQRIHLPGLRRHVLREERGDEALFREAPEEVGAEEERWQAERQIETIPDLLHWACARHAARVALQIRREGQWLRCTYGELRQRVEAASRLLQGQGLEPGQRVLLCGENGPEWAVAHLAASCLGLGVVPLDPQTRAEELGKLAEFTGARALLGAQACWEFLKGRGLDLRFFDLRALPQEPPESPWQAPRVTAEMAASILFTTGTAVEPRGVVLTHGNFIADLLALAEIQRLYETDRMLSLLPLHHALEFTGGLLMSLWGGATTTYLETLNSREILQTIQATGTTALIAVPRLLKILADRIQRLEVQHLPHPSSLRTVRLIVSGGAPLDPELFEVYQQRLGVAVHEGYGLTEAGPVISVNPPGRARRGSVGQVLPGQEVRIDRPAGQGEGEILVRGPNIMAGYLDRPDLTAQVLREGWLYTGDLGYLDEEGYLFITGRCKNLIVTGAGKNVYPEEVEALYRGLPHVAELGVVGVRSPRTLSEEVHGVAVLERTSTSAVEGEIMARAYQISRSLPSFQRIQRLHLWRRPLPRRDDGQVDRQALEAELRLERRASEQIDAPPWEREVFGQICRITGLTASEVMAHSEAPLDTLLDSLMAVEFAALIERWSGVRLAEFDRSRRTLRSLLDELEPQLAGREAQMGMKSQGSYWSALLAGGATGRDGAASPLFQGLFRGAAGPLLRAYLSLEAEGLEHLPQDGPYLIAANHATHLDACCILLAARPHLERLSLAAAQDHPPGAEGWWSRLLLNVVPVGRQGDFAEGLARLRGALGPRRPLLVFPEGGRSPGGQLQPFKPGIGLLALELGTPVVPVHIRGTCEVMGRRRPRRQPLRLRFGRPVEMAPYALRRQRLSSYEVYREIAEALHRRIEALGAGT